MGRHRKKRLAASAGLTIALIVLSPRAWAGARIGASTYRPKKVFRLQGKAQEISWSIDGRLVAVTQQLEKQALVVVIDISRGKTLFEKAFPRMPSVAFDDPTHLFVAVSGGTLSRYSIPSGRPDWTRPLSPKARIATTTAGRIALVDRHGIQILDGRSGVSMGTVAGSRFLARDEAPTVWMDAGKIIALDKAGKRILFWSGYHASPFARKLTGCRLPPTGAAFSASGRALALLCPNSGKKTASTILYTVTMRGILFRRFSKSMSLLMTSQVASLSVGDGSVPTLALGLRLGGALVRTKDDFVPIPAGHSAPTIVAQSPNGNALLLATARTLVVFCRGCKSVHPHIVPGLAPRDQRETVVKGRVTAFLGGQRYLHVHSAKAYGLALTHKWLFTSSADGTIGILDRWSGHVLRHVGLPGPVHAEWVEADQEGNKLVAGWGDGHLSVYDTHSGRLLLTWPAHPRAVFEAHFSKDGSRILSCGQDGIPRIWDAATGRNIALVPSSKSQTKRLTWSSMATQPTNTCAFHATKPWVIMGKPTGAVVWVDWRTGRVMAQTKLSKQSVMSVLAWDKGDKIVAATARGICLWEGRPDKRPNCLPTKGENVGMTWIAPYRVAAVGNADPIPGAVLVNLDDMKILRRFVASPRTTSPRVELAKGRPIFDLAYDPALRLLHGTLQSGWLVTWRMDP